MAVDRAALCAILIGVVGLGAGYAVRTPAWQAPDEPAHFNYARQVADGAGRLPELEEGDYPHAAIQELTRRRFPPELPVDGLEYEDYQPPLYYLLAALAIRAAPTELSGRLLAVRLVGVLLGALTVALTYQVAAAVDARDRALATAAAGILAFVPMRLAIAASANNDALALAVAAAAILVAARRSSGRTSDRAFVLVGAAVATVALLTKVSLYPLVALLAAAEVVYRFPSPKEHASWAVRTVRAARRAAAPAATVLLVAVAAAVPWFARNALVYGPADILGTAAHDRIVVGQPRTAAWIADYGLGAWASRLVTFTHHSFWGVFGWMSVFMEPLVYAALAVLWVLAVVGFVVYARRLWLDPAGRRSERAAVTVLALALGLSVCLYLAYNVTFVQHQGRYLFTALSSIAVFMALGTRELARLAAGGRSSGSRSAVTERVALYGVVAALYALSWIALHRYVVPGLG